MEPLVSSAGVGVGRLHGSFIAVLKNLFLGRLSWPSLLLTMESLCFVNSVLIHETEPWKTPLWELVREGFHLPDFQVCPPPSTPHSVEPVQLHGLTAPLPATVISAREIGTEEEYYIVNTWRGDPPPSSRCIYTTRGTYRVLLFCISRLQAQLTLSLPRDNTGSQVKAVRSA